MYHDIPHRYVGKTAALVLRPLAAPVDTYPQPEFRSQEQQITIRSVSLSRAHSHAHR